MRIISLSRTWVSEALGSALLLAVVVGSGIMAERLFVGQTGLALLANAIASAAGLLVLILMLAPISGAHFNPIVSLSAWMQKQMSARTCLWMMSAQFSGAIVGVFLAHWMFELPTWTISTHARSGWALALSEGVASFGLIAIIIASTRSRSSVTPFAVAAYILSAYWFTSSTSFANPAVTLARALTDSFAGIAPLDVGNFVLAQCLGAIFATLLFSWLYQDFQTE